MAMDFLPIDELRSERSWTTFDLKVMAGTQSREAVNRNFGKLPYA